MEDDGVTADCKLKTLNDALKSNSWHEAVIILNKYNGYFANCQFEWFSVDNKTLTTQLIYAAIDQKCFNVVEFLIKRGCDVNYGIKMPYRRYKRSPLFHASKTGCVQIVKLLLEAGSEKDCMNNTGCTALYEAVFNGHTEVVQLLLENGCDPNIPDVYGKTPLHIIPFMCVEEEKKEKCMQLLLEGGADISLKSECGQTPADVAIQYKFCPLLKCLMKNAQKLGFRTIPFNLESLGSRVLPEFLLSPLNTEGVYSVAQCLVQLHPIHMLNSHTREEFTRLCFTDVLPGFYVMAKKLYRLMLLSGVPELPTRSPLTLQDSCRIFIRRHFATECWYRIHRLPLPKLLKDYLLLKDSIKDCAPI